ncbi:MAG: hypothetical protein EBT06_07145 [Gammaproteobacteria bacterium]|nr:hypothetical protein [Gammaproteobacteria bacterium]NBY24076.1 hypothetical protein [Gammaproteobacteria bacterium]NDE35589.1 hypothetical protein [Gammaproteobacteria bacterium]NDE57553.1 hypothetical protein [Gammaproteobacteria bacterium]NDG88822.1 hypothetical protein [Gammaproteobacteria bacterium]
MIQVLQKPLHRLFRRRSDLEREPFQWYLLLGRAPLETLRSPDVSALTPIYPPSDRFWADPFLWRQGGETFVFFEEYPFATRRGHISAMAIDAFGQPLGDSKPLLQEPYHLSYPYLFAFGDDLYMVPEKKAVRCVDLYRCTRFPDRWEKVRTLFKGPRMVDSTLFEYEGRWWLFCSVKGQGIRYDESLFAYYTDHPIEGDWLPHPLNPLVRDFALGRSAGRVIKDPGGRLLRPSQDCTGHYGAGLNLSEIITLTPSAYEEKRIWHRRGEETPGVLGLHHLDWHEGLLVMDAQRQRPKAQALD